MTSFGKIMTLASGLFLSTLTAEAQGGIGPAPVTVKDKAPEKLVIQNTAAIGHLPLAFPMMGRGTTDAHGEMHVAICSVRDKDGYATVYAAGHDKDGNGALSLSDEVDHLELDAGTKYEKIFLMVNTRDSIVNAHCADGDNRPGKKLPTVMWPLKGKTPDALGLFNAIAGEMKKKGTFDTVSELTNIARDPNSSVMDLGAIMLPKRRL